MSKMITAGARPRVLLVDDEEEILIALGDILEDTCDLLTTVSPKEGLAFLEQYQDVSVIISDQYMPEMTGDQFLEAAHKISDARAILLTGYADLDSVVAALNHGGIVAYLPKPCKVEHVLSLVYEAHKHWAAQRALRVEQVLLRGLMDSLPFGLVFSDEQGNCIRSNRDITSANETEHYAPALRPVINKMRQQVQKTGEAEECVEVAPSEDENARLTWHQIVRFALRWPEEAGLEGSWQVCADRDVTQRVMMEKRLNNAERLEALGRLAGGVAHDFNNLLAVLTSCLDMLGELNQDGEKAQASRVRWLEQAFSAVNRGEGLIKRLLQFGRAGQSDKASIINIVSFLEERVQLFRQSFYGADPAIRFNLSVPEEGLPGVLTNPQQLEMALLNLCVNARDAMPDGGTVTMSAKKIKRSLEGISGECDKNCALALSVSDDGEGMSEEIQSHIFEPFFTTKSDGKGTGLGLAGVYSFAVAQHGDVKVESTLGEGTTLTVVLPFVKSS